MPGRSPSERSVSTFARPHDGVGLASGSDTACFVGWVSERRGRNPPSGDRIQTVGYALGASPTNTTKPRGPLPSLLLPFFAFPYFIASSRIRGVHQKHRVVLVVAVVGAGRVGDFKAMLAEEGAELVDRLAARKLERIVMKADVALAVLALSATSVGLRDPEQRLAVAPADEAGAVVFA